MDIKIPPYPPQSLLGKPSAIFRTAKLFTEPPLLNWAYLKKLRPRYRQCVLGNIAILGADGQEGTAFGHTRLQIKTPPRLIAP
jgi:hypothetical protein